MMPGIGGAQLSQIESAIDEKQMARVEGNHLLHDTEGTQQSDPF